MKTESGTAELGTAKSGIIESGVIESGPIFRRDGSKGPEETSYELMFVDQSFLNQIMELQDVIAQSLPDEEIFRLDSKDYFRSHFQVDSAVMAAFTKGEMIAYHVISFPGEGEDNFGRDIAIPKNELKCVAHLETMAVHPEYRGNSLQRRMIGHHIKVIDVLGFDHICCTVSPKNHASMKNLFANGLKIRGIKAKFGGKIRYIMHRSLLRPDIIQPERLVPGSDAFRSNSMRSVCLLEVDGSDLAAQADLLKRGFIGFKAEKQGDIMKVFYAAPGAASFNGPNLQR